MQHDIDLKAIRGERTQDEMARLLGVNIRTYWTHEKAGKAPLTWVMVLKNDIPKP